MSQPTPSNCVCGNPNCQHVVFTASLKAPDQTGITMSDTPERIYLVDGEYDGTVTKVWSDDPTPSEYHDASEAVEYVRADVHERVVEDSDRNNRLFANACETLGAVHKALAGDQASAVIGFEPQMVEELKRERDAAIELVQALAAHVEVLDDIADRALEMGEPEDLAELAQAREMGPATSLAHRDAELIRSLKGELAGAHSWVRRTAIWLERQAQAREPDPRDACELECGAYGTYCKCNAEGGA